MDELIAVKPTATRSKTKVRASQDLQRGVFSPVYAVYDRVRNVLDLSQLVNAIRLCGRSAVHASVKLDTTTLVFIMSARLRAAAHRPLTQAELAAVRELWVTATNNAVVADAMEECLVGPTGTSGFRGAGVFGAMTAPFEFWHPYYVEIDAVRNMIINWVERSARPRLSLRGCTRADVPDDVQTWNVLHILIACENNFPETTALRVFHWLKRNLDWNLVLEAHFDRRMREITSNFNAVGDLGSRLRAVELFNGVVHPVIVSANAEHHERHALRARLRLSALGSRRTTSLTALKPISAQRTRRTVTTVQQRRSAAAGLRRGRCAMRGFRVVARSADEASRSDSTSKPSPCDLMQAAFALQHGTKLSLMGRTLTDCWKSACDRLVHADTDRRVMAHVLLRVGLSYEIPILSVWDVAAFANVLHTHAQRVLQVNNLEDTFVNELQEYVRKASSLLMERLLSEARRLQPEELQLLYSDLCRVDHTDSLRTALLAEHQSLRETFVPVERTERVFLVRARDLDNTPALKRVAVELYRDPDTGALREINA